MPGDRWFVDESYLKVAGRWRYLCRAVDQFRQVIDVLLTAERDTAAAGRFFTRALACARAPVEVTTDRAAAYLRCSRRSSRLRGTSPTSTRTTRSELIMAGSRRGCGGCAG